VNTISTTESESNTQRGRNLRLVGAWAVWIALAYRWHYFCTLTLDNDHAGVESLTLQKHVRAFVKRWFFEEGARRGYATRVVRADRRDGFEYVRFQGAAVDWWKNGNLTWKWVAGLEPQRNGRLHAHLLLHVPRFGRVWDGRLDYRTGWDAWAWGGTRFEKPRNPVAVPNYLAKYVLSGGDVVLSDSFQSDGQHAPASPLTGAGAGSVCAGSRASR